MDILESVKKLAAKLGADTNGRTIAEQLNAINRKLDDSYVGSRDIAEAVNKFADKEDGTAVLSKKTITENGTYTASDEDVTGYSEVTVNVEMTFNRILAYGNTSGAVKIINISSNDVTVNPMTDSGASFTLPIRKITISGTSPSHSYIFVPTSDYDGFYKDGNKLVFTGDEVNPTGGGVYIASINEMMGTKTMTKLFDGQRTPFTIE